MTTTATIASATRDYARATAIAIVATARRTWRTLHAIITVTRRHVPRWVGIVLTVCLFIPGPLDEMLVLLAIAVLVAFKPVMRSELVSATREAWAR